MELYEESWTLTAIETRRESLWQFVLLWKLLRTESSTDAKRLIPKTSTLWKLFLCRKGKNFFKFSVAKTRSYFVWKTLQLDTASTTNTLALDDLWSMCPAGFTVNYLIRPSHATLHTYGRGVIRPVGQTGLVCETQRKYYPLKDLNHLANCT